MDVTEPVFLGLDLAGVLALSSMLVMFAFAVWFGATRCTVGIGPDEQESRMDSPSRP